ncbi:hypothetical protein [Metapseudomonas otitidis]|uniref:hypothetical protein n=1 Tax=Metapseudomonas otitidis TaxID=319939 RepID=UPI001CA44BA0|nr:hypothetical protein [Pseudomonas otitidis]QZX85579.1 hypothetical protein K6751_13075 [Pseudomonas otitidis]
MIINASFVNRPREYDSFEGSIQASEKRKKNISEEKINGKIFKNYEFNGKELIIETENKYFLYISTRHEAINWKISTSRPSIKQIKISTQIIFQLPSGEKIPWNWKKKLDSFLGKQFAISASDQDLFIFYRNGEENIFSLLKDSANQHYLLLSET